MVTLHLAVLLPPPGLMQTFIRRYVSPSNQRRDRIRSEVHLARVSFSGCLNEPREIGMLLGEGGSSMDRDSFRSTLTSSDLFACGISGSSGAADGSPRLTFIVPCATVQSAAEEPQPRCTAHDGHHRSNQRAADGSVGLAHEASSITVQSGAGEPQPQNLAITWHADTPLEPLDSTTQRTTSSAREGDNESGLGADLVAALLYSCTSAVVGLPGDLGKSAHLFLYGDLQKLSIWSRDIFPMCRMPARPDVCWPAAWSERRRTAVLQVGDVTPAGLSFLYCAKRCVVEGPATQLQSTVQTCLLKKLVMIVGRMDSVEIDGSGKEAFASLVGRGSVDKSPPLIADCVDVLDA